MKKSIIICMLALTMGLSGCSSPVTDSKKEAPKFDTGKIISVVSREDGSGTRGAFVELFKVEATDASGKKKDLTTKEAVIVNKTDVMLTNIAGDTYSIGYVSLGSLNSKVKALDIDGVKPSAENVKNSSYTISRPFNIAVKGEATGLAKDFIDFILSEEGQAVVSKGYIAVNDKAPKYSGNKPEGKIVIAGSSSVSPVMEKLMESYKKINPNAKMELQTTDSTSGMTGAVDGTCDIGMASRELKSSEKEKLNTIPIALDGIAVIVNINNSAVTNLSKDQVKKIFAGEVTKWSDVK